MESLVKVFAQHNEAWFKIQDSRVLCVTYSYRMCSEMQSESAHETVQNNIKYANILKM